MKEMETIMSGLMRSLRNSRVKHIKTDNKPDAVKVIEAASFPARTILEDYGRKRRGVEKVDQSVEVALGVSGNQSQNDAIQKIRLGFGLENVLYSLLHEEHNAEDIPVMGTVRTVPFNIKTRFMAVANTFDKRHNAMAILVTDGSDVHIYCADTKEIPVGCDLMISLVARETNSCKVVADNTHAVSGFVGADTFSVAYISKEKMNRMDPFAWSVQLVINAWMNYHFFAMTDEEINLNTTVFKICLSGVASQNGRFEYRSGILPPIQWIQHILAGIYKKEVQETNVLLSAIMDIATGVATTSVWNENVRVWKEEDLRDPNRKKDLEALIDFHD